MKRVAGYMGVVASEIEVRYSEEDKIRFAGKRHDSSEMIQRNAAGKFEIWLEVTNLNDPERMVAAIAHCLGKVLLKGLRTYQIDADEIEPLTDLLVVFMGLGLFPANTDLREDYWFDLQQGGWTIDKQSHLSMNMFGYAFAMLARSRDENQPIWMKSLRLDVRKACSDSLACLPSIFDPRQALNNPVRFPFRSHSTEKAIESEPRQNDEMPVPLKTCSYCSELITENNAIEEDHITHDGLAICSSCRFSMLQSDEEAKLIAAINAKVREDAGRLISKVMNWIAFAGILLLLIMVFKRAF